MLILHPSMGAVLSKLGVTRARAAVTLLLYAARHAVGRWLLRLPLVPRVVSPEAARNAGWLGVLALYLSAARALPLVLSHSLAHARTQSLTRAHG